MANEAKKRKGKKSGKEAIEGNEQKEGEVRQSAKKVKKTAPPAEAGGAKKEPIKINFVRIWSRLIVIGAVMVFAWYKNSGVINEQPFAGLEEDINAKSMKTRCSANFDSTIKEFPKCIPRQCGRFIADSMFSQAEVYAIRDLMNRVYREAKTESTVMNFDYQTGNLEYEGGSVNLFQLNKTRPIFQKRDLLIYQNVKGKLQRMISTYFLIDHWALQAASPFLLTRYTAKFPKNSKDEYWHPLVHQEYFKTYQYSGTMFLSNYGKDFDGGRLVFIDNDNTNRTVDPKMGRSIVFSSGADSLHYTGRVYMGVRLSITVGFTCNLKHKVKDPKF